MLIIIIQKFSLIRAIKVNLIFRASAKFRVVKKGRGEIETTSSCYEEENFIYNNIEEESFQ